MKKYIFLLLGFIFFTGETVLADEVHSSTQQNISTREHKNQSEKTTSIVEKPKSLTEKNEESTKAIEVKKQEKLQGWVRNQQGSWYFYKENHTMATSTWEGDYYLESDGKMATNKWVDHAKYYVDSTGKWIPDKVKVSGWKQQGNGWYFYDEQEQLVTNQWVQTYYYVGNDGRMVTSSWIDGDKYYVAENGEWIPGVAKGKVGWNQDTNGAWHYYKNGIPVRNQWIGNYYILSNGEMATNTWVDNARYYVGNDGAWIETPSEQVNKKHLVLELARNHIGTEQYDSWQERLVQVYNTGMRSYSGYYIHTWDDWCDVFISSIFQMAGVLDLIQKEAYVPFHIHLFKNQGIWIGNSTPQSGDIVTFDWDEDGVADHIAFVEEVVNGKIVTLEGNTHEDGGEGSRVLRKTHDMDSSVIFGYARPQYR